LYKILSIILAGGLGTICRYGLSGLVHKMFGSMFPLGTMVVNIIGSVSFGLVWGLSVSRLAVSPALRAALLIGFMGAFTTFSTYMFETSALLRNSQWIYAGANVLVQNLVGIAALVLGIALTNA